MEVPSFSALDEAQADISAMQAAWGKYSDFHNERQELADKDWLTMRDQVGAGGRRHG